MSGRVEYLLDTNVLSETRKKNADDGVTSFLQTMDPSALYISVLTVGEFRKGVVGKQRNDAKGAALLSSWVDGIELTFADRILAIDGPAARLWGEWSGERSRTVVDTLIAATAFTHELTLVTRNLRDVKGLPVKVLNPWKQ